MLYKYESYYLRSKTYIARACLFCLFIFHVALDLLERERKEHLNLKLTWQMANDQFLESQRLLMIDMKRMGSVLTEEQQRKVEGQFIAVFIHTYLLVHGKRTYQE